MNSLVYVYISMYILVVCDLSHISLLLWLLGFHSYNRAPVVIEVHLGDSVTTIELSW